MKGTIPLINAPKNRPVNRGAQPSGAALVLVLSLLVLCSVVLLAFLSQSLQIRLTASSSEGSIKADLLARSAVDEVILSLREEIFAGSSPETVSGIAIQFPAKDQSAVPSRKIAGTIPEDAGFATLLKQSFAGVPTYPADDVSTYPKSSDHPAVTPASTLSTAEPARDGRFVSARRWNTPGLLGGDGLTQDDQLPFWVYMGRSGPIHHASDDEVAAMADRSHENASRAIGRYAYQVYDISGLLDVNLAGHPETLSPQQVNELKGTLAGAVLEAIPGLTEPDALLAWRTGELSPEEFFTAQVSNTDGFASSADGERRFFNRQDLLRYSTSGNALPKAALPYLTVFNRKKNAPVFSYPATGSITENAVNANPLRVRMAVAGTSVIDGFTWRAGDPVVPRRFPLSRLEWLRYDGPGAGASAESIQAAFGLVWDARKPSDDDPADLRGDRWVYVGNAGNPDPDQPAGEISTLKEVAAEGREPNFFELLKAAIHRDSLGQAIAGTDAPDIDTFHGVTDLHILRIGACIIDQADADSYPTLINFQVNDGAVNPTVEVHGVEDLPYISRVAPFYINPDWPNDPGPEVRQMRGFLVPELWNPHQPGTSAGPQPERLRLFFTGGVEVRTKSNESRFGRFTFNTGSVVFSQENFTLFRSPRPLTASMAIGAGTFRTLPFKDYPIGGGDFLVGGEIGGLVGSMVATPAPGGDEEELQEPWWWDGYYRSDHGFRQYWVRESIGERNPQNPFNAILQFENYRGKYQNYNVFAGDVYTDDADLNTSLGIRGSGSSVANGFRKEDFPIPYLPDGPDGAWKTANAGALSNSSQEGVGLPTVSPDSWQDLLTIKRQGSAQIYKSDPRTSRIGVGRYNFNPRNATPTSPNYGRFTDWRPEHSFAAGLRPVNSGHMSQGPISNYPIEGTASPNLTLTGTNANQYRPAMFERNVEEDGNGAYYRDNDGVVRPADNQHQTWVNSVYNQSQARPIVLNRPFRSVGELGYVFRDLPHRSLDLNSGVSADAALLDYFCLNESPSVVSGVVNVGAAPEPVLQALVQGTLRTLDGSVGIDTENARSLAEDLVTRRADTLPVDTARLVTMTGSPTVTAAGTGLYPGIKTRREAVLRSLASVHNERTWNLFIDVIAQSGQFPPTASKLGDFAVSAERRYWVHIAIDRYTGEVVDELRELVLE